MVDTDRTGSPGLHFILGAEELGRRMVNATANIRRVGVTERPDVIAARFYFDRFERLFRLAEPNSKVIEDLESFLKTVAGLEAGVSLSSLGGSSPYSKLSNYVGELVDQNMRAGDDAGNGDGDDAREKAQPGERDEVSDVWKSWQSLKHVINVILSCGVLSLTPVARPLIQLSVELQDFLFGRRDGSLLRARQVVRASRRGRNAEQRKAGRIYPSHAAAEQLTPWQSLIASLAVSTSKIDGHDEPLWLEACNQSLEATTLYLSERGFSSRTLEPLNKLAWALREELAGGASNLFADPLYEDRHGPELSPSKPPRLHRLYFNLLLISARKTFKDVRRLTHLKKSWFDDQLKVLSLRDQSGDVITSETVRQLDRQQVDDPGSESEAFRYRQAARVASGVFLREAHLVGSVGKPVPFALSTNGQELTASVPPELSVQTLLQAALLYEPRHFPKKPSKRVSAERR